MFFQINLTPKEKKTSDSSNNVKPNKDFYIILAPFQPQTRITLETPVNTKTECFLHVKNTGNRSLNVNITKRPPQERNVDLSFTNVIIEANSEVSLEINWSPQEAGSWREVLQLSDSRRVKYEIALVMQALDLRKKGQKSRPNARKPLVPKSNSTQQSYLSKNSVAPPKESFGVKKQNESRSKRTRIDSYLDEPDKENIDKNLEYDRFIESTITKKQRKEILSTTSIISTDAFVLTPVKFNDKHIKKSETQTNHYDFTPQERFILLEERCETKTLRRETYVKTPKHRQMGVIIEEEKERDVFDDSLSPNGIADFSLLIDNINFTPKLPTTPNGVYEFSSRACSDPDFATNSNNTFNITEKNKNEKKNEEAVFLPPSPKSRKPSTFLKPTRLLNFDVLTPITPAPKRKVEFASSSLLSMDCSNMETPRRYADTSYRDLDSSTAREILEADMWVKPQNIFPVRRVVTEKAQEKKENRPELLNDTFELKVSKTCMLEISPPKQCKSQKMSPAKYYRPIEKVRFSPSKNGKVSKHHEPLVKKKQISNSFKNSIPGVRIANLSLAGITRKRVNQSLSVLKETSVKLHDPNDFITKFCNPDPFAATMTEDPFLSSTLYYDEKWVHLQEVEFKKWLNVLMTPPEHLSTDVDTNLVDIGKLWQSCRMKEDVVLAESKESISARIHTDTRLNTLRKAACMMFRNPEVSNILSRTAVCVEKGILVIRQDRDLNRDIGLQKGILELFLSYNPLWLRIGLETVYGETIPLRSNNDLIGLTRFLLVRFFSDQFIVKQHSHPTVVGMKLPTFTTHMNKFMLKKFLLFVFFLDFAKANKLIGHDPCLFHKKAPHKDSRSILLTFSREVLSGIGDITKVLKSYGYIVCHKQTYLDEFDYAVNEMSSDLRDGVRLCRAMELITGSRNLTCQCRVPAISRLQKVHNVNIALKALLDSGYVLAGDIDAKSISDGHREKTLSLLWQIIYKFQAPRFEKAATCLQTWWRSKLWYVRVKNLLKNRKINAACVIQRSWKCYSARKILHQLRVKHEKEMKLKHEAASVIQRKWILRKEGMKQRNQFLETRAAILKIQKWWRRIQATRPFIEILRNKREAVILFQTAWRAKKQMEIERLEYLKLKEVCCKVQIRWRAKLLGRSERRDLEELKKAVLFVQRKWRASKLMNKERESYERILSASILIQKWWRGILLMKKDYSDFMLKKYAVRVFEKKWIEKKTISEERKSYLEMKRRVIIIQRTWRRYSETKNEVSQLQKSRRSSIKIQSWWRAVVVQRKYKITRNSCLRIQNWWRSLQKTKACQLEYSKKKNAVLILQKNWRMTRTRRYYWQLKSAVLNIESWYENIIFSRTFREVFLKKKMSVKKIEDWWLNWKIAKTERGKFLKLREKTVIVQRKWRAKKLTEETKKNFQTLKSSAVKIQSWFRMVKQKQKFESFLKKLKATITIQRRWRAILARRRAQIAYMNIREAVTLLQRKWRATKSARLKRIEFLHTREQIIKIQSQWKCFTAKKAFQRKKQATLKIQNWWRHKSSGIKIRNEYLKLRSVTIYLQNRVRRNKQALRTQANYLELRSAALKIQRRWRARRIGKEVRKQFEKYRRAVIFVQSIWRMKVEMRRYKNITQAVLKIQTVWRAKCLGRQIKKDYLILKSATLLIQRRWREVRLGNEIRKKFLENRQRVIVIQSTWRMKLALKNYRSIKYASLTLQSHWRARSEGRKCRTNFLALKFATVLIQRQFRANKLCLVECRRYQTLKKSILLIQRKWRAELETRRCSKEFAYQKSSAVKIQNWWRSILKMRECRNDYLKKKALIVKLQRRYRGNLLAKEARSDYENLRKVVLKIQACWRFILAKRELKSLLLRRKKAVGVIENWWVEVLRIKKIEEEKREEIRRYNRAAAKIQALWRGHKVRRDNSEKMAELRKRTEKAAKQAIPAQTLANRLQDSINVFLFSNDLGRLSMCLSSLDVITRLSPNGCVTVCKVGLVDKIYMTLVRSNRSVPWMDACTRATSVLVTLAKYPPTKPFVLKEEYIETLARFLTVTVEKEVPLFLHLSTLMWILIDDSDYAKAILKDSRSVWLLNSLCDTISRKKQKNAHAALKGKEEVLPNPKPDWGLRQKQPRLFGNVLYAATSIVRRLNEHEENS